jgi:hypothetical protein
LIATEEQLSEIDASRAAEDFDEKSSSEPMKHSMRTNEKRHSQGRSEKEEDNPFGEEDSLEITCGIIILDDILRHIDDSRSHRNRYREGTRR